MAGRPISSTRKSGKKGGSRNSSGNNNNMFILGGAGAIICALVAIIAYQMGQNKNDNHVAQNNNPQPAVNTNNNPQSVVLDNSVDTNKNEPSTENGTTENGNKEGNGNTGNPPTTNTPDQPATSENPAAMNPPGADSGTMPNSPGGTSNGSMDGNTSKSDSRGKMTKVAEQGERSVDLDLPDLIEMVMPSVVKIETSQNGTPTGLGSGYVVSEEGIVVTNHHVMEGATSAIASFKNGTKCRVLGYYYADHQRDICIIHIEKPKEKLIPITISKELPREGTTAIGFGSPIGLSFTTSDGIISAIRPEAQFQKEVSPKHRGTWIQTTTPISPGNSGGPLVDLKGNVLGMNTLHMKTGQNLNFAISSLDIRDAIKQASGLNLVKFTDKKIQDKEESLAQRIAIDYEGTPKAYKLAAKIENVEMVMASIAVDPTGVFTNNFVSNAQAALSKVNINVNRAFDVLDTKDGLLFMILYIDIPRGNKFVAGTQEFHAIAFLLVQDEESGQLVKVWESQDTILGYASLESALTGNLPNTFKSNTANFFSSIRSTVIRSRKEWDKLKSLSPDEFAKAQKDKELQIIREKQGKTRKKEKGQIFDFKLPESK